MKKCKLFVVLFAMLCLAVLTAAVSADQDGNNRYCITDEYGCWVTNEETGGQDYIMFWSEEIRQYFMGDKTAPYQNVVDRCTDCENGILPLGSGRGYRGGYRTVYRYDGKEFDTAEEFLQYLAEQGGYDSCYYVSDHRIECK